MNPTATEQIEPQLTDADLSRILKRSIGAIKRDRANGKGPRFMKIGKMIRYDPRDVREYLDGLKRLTIH